jgi:hypothetical protein
LLRCLETELPQFKFIFTLNIPKITSSEGAGWNTPTIDYKSQKATKNEPGAWEYNGPPYHWGSNAETWSSMLGVGCKAGSMTVYKILSLQNPKN